MITEYKNHKLTNISEDLQNLATVLSNVDIPIKKMMDNGETSLTYLDDKPQKTCLLAANIVEKFIKTQEYQINTIIEMAKLKKGFEWTNLKEKIMREEFWDCLQIEINQRKENHD